MVLFTRSVRVSSYHLKKIFSSSQIPVAVLMVAVFIVQNMEAVREFCAAVDINATPFAFPHLANDFICQLIIMAGAIALFCNAPFEDDEYIYFVSRSGRTAWTLGQVFYVLQLSLIYVLFLIIVSIVPLAGHLRFADEWGKIWGTLAKTDAGMQFGLIFSVTEHLVSHYEPLSALVISFLLEWACVSWLGLVIYMLNKLTSSAAGTVTAAIFVLLDVCIYNDWGLWAYRFSPVSLAKINTYAGYNLKYGINMTYGALFFAVGIPVLAGCCILSGRRIRKLSRKEGLNG